MTDPRPDWPNWREDEVVLLSALSHWTYCPRRCGLIHLDQIFEHNVHTQRGQMLHERADTPGYAIAAGVRAVRAIPLWSDRLGIAGRADIVEFHDERPAPVEYKTGKRNKWLDSAVQLCAQALCLEEMLGCPVPEGAVFYHATRNRRVVLFDAALRAQTETVIQAVRGMLASGTAPPAVDDARCPECSLHDACLPAVLAAPARVRGLATDLFRAAAE